IRIDSSDLPWPIGVSRVRFGVRGRRSLRLEITGRMEVLDLLDPASRNLGDTAHLITGDGVGDRDLLFISMDEKPDRVHGDQRTPGELEHLFGVLPAGAAPALRVLPENRDHRLVAVTDVGGHFIFDRCFFGRRHVLTLDSRGSILVG
ncbi:MAG: hypothetical protein O3A19_09660, partial [Planctomycetota bacterium]|nr:hypothetical protein [Planctomycetota bacterium]